jgi:hypothetical protein
VLRLEGRNLVGQVFGVEPGCKAPDVARVLSDRVRRTAVGLELDEEAIESGEDAHDGLELNLDVAARRSPWTLTGTEESR